MNKAQFKRMTSVKSDLECMYQGHLNKFKFTPYLVREVERIFISLSNEKTDTTICNEIKDYFEKKKFNVKAQGIGWIIEL